LPFRGGVIGVPGAQRLDGRLEHPIRRLEVRFADLEMHHVRQFVRPLEDVHRHERCHVAGTLRDHR